MAEDLPVCPRCDLPVGHESKTVGHPLDVLNNRRPRPKVTYHLYCWLEAVEELRDRGDLDMPEMRNDAAED